MVAIRLQTGNVYYFNEVVIGSKLLFLFFYICLTAATKMKRKVAKKVGKLRLSPNEEAQILKEELERRRKLRLQQVRRIHRRQSYIIM